MIINFKTWRLYGASLIYIIYSITMSENDKYMLSKEVKKGYHDNLKMTVENLLKHIYSLLSLSVKISSIYVIHKQVYH